MRGISTLKKGELIEAMLLQDEKDAANEYIAATPSVTRREKATVVRGRRPSASEQEKAKADAGTVPEAGKAETAGTSEERDTASAEGRQELRPQTNGSPSGETHNIRTSGNRTWNNPARRAERRHHVRKMHRSVAEETACSRDGRMRPGHSRMQIAPSSQESEGCSGTIPSAAIMQGQAVRARFLRWPQMKSMPVKLLNGRTAILAPPGAYTLRAVRRGTCGRRDESGAGKPFGPPAGRHPAARQRAGGIRYP